jgi:dTDP-4-amino-4,6-dideoxygalactose transaminase
MSQVSKAIFEHSVDYSIIEKRRIDNYRTLLDRLRAYAVFPRLEPDVVPSGFPVRVAKRDAIRQALFDREIYPPVHWLIDGIIPNQYEDSHRLAHQIMTLPCDQRYGHEDMERIADAFLQSLAQHE